MTVYGNIPDQMTINARRPVISRRSALSQLKVVRLGEFPRL